MSPPVLTMPRRIRWPRRPLALLFPQVGFLESHAASPLANRIEPKQRQNSTGVVTKLNAIFHENMLTKHWREGYPHQVEGRSKERSSNQAALTNWVLDNIPPPQHRAFEKIPALPALVRNGFEPAPAVAPAENMT